MSGNEVFFNKIFTDSQIEELAKLNTGYDIDSAKKLINTYVEEAKFGFRRIEKYLDYENKKTLVYLN